MSVHNRTTILSLRATALVLLILIIVDFFLSSIPGSLGDFFRSHVISYVAAAVLILLALLKAKYFYYEDEYEIIHIRQQPLFVDLMSLTSTYGYSRYEFPKRILKSVSLVESFPLRKSIHFTVETTGKTDKLRKVDVSFMSKEDIDYVMRSMNAIVKRNSMEK